MRLAAESTIAACEQALLEIADSSIDESLTLPTHLRYLVAGGEAALAQVIITWARHNQARDLITFIGSESGSQIDDFVRRLPGMTGALCADRIWGLNQRTILTEAVKKEAIKRLDQLQSNQPQPAYRGASIEIVCADHLGKGEPYLLYQPNRKGGVELRPSENFRALANWLLRKTIPKQYHPALNPESAQAIGGMLYEIFKNTDDHALTDANGDILSVSIRALKTTHLSISPSILQTIANEFAPFARYCQTLAVPRDAVQTHLFELSILDSGPGFAVSWTGKALDQLSEQEEERAVIECFDRGSAKGDARFGEGLPHVVRVLQQSKGFLRLRTGRLSFFIDFARPVQSVHEQHMLQRWCSESLDSLAPVAGSLLTIIVPMER